MPMEIEKWEQVEGRDGFEDQLDLMEELQVPLWFLAGEAG